MSEKVAERCFLTYIVIGLLVTGFAWADFEKQGKAEQITNPDKLVLSGQYFMAGMLSGMVWPAYITYRISR
jgi:hypothetical protein